MSAVTNQHLDCPFTTLTPNNHIKEKTQMIERAKHIKEGSENEISSSSNSMTSGSRIQQHTRLCQARNITTLPSLTTITTKSQHQTILDVGINIKNSTKQRARATKQHMGSDESTSDVSNPLLCPSSTIGRKQSGKQQSLLPTWGKIMRKQQTNIEKDRTTMKQFIQS
jgi:hypothetical protein